MGRARGRLALRRRHQPATAPPAPAPTALATMPARPEYTALLEQLSEGEWRATTDRVVVTGDLHSLLTRKLREAIAAELPGAGLYSFNIRCVDEIGDTLTTHVVTDQSADLKIGRHRADETDREHIHVDDRLHALADSTADNCTADDTPV